MPREKYSKGLRHVKQMYWLVESCEANGESGSFSREPQNGH